MANGTASLRGLCPAPFFQESGFSATGGCRFMSFPCPSRRLAGSPTATVSSNLLPVVKGRVCQPLTAGIHCCLPCPLTDWAYADSLDKLGSVAGWITVVSLVCCCFLLLSWLLLPVEKTSRHYLSISLTCAIVLMNLGFIIPLAAKPEECYDEITPHGMGSSPICAASGTFLLFGGWAGVMWVFLRSLSLHLQICWQVVVGRTFMWVAQILGWGVPVAGTILLAAFSGVSFRFGQTCHINHQNSLGVFWIPLLVFAGLTVIIQFTTFAYCSRVYLASLADSAASTRLTGMPTYSTSIRTLTPRQAYQRVRRVIQLQWRGIVIVLIIICDVVFFAVVFVFQDNFVETSRKDPERSLAWVTCLVMTAGDKHACLTQARHLVVPLPTVMALLFLLACNGLWLLLLLGRWTMISGWSEFIGAWCGRRHRLEFVSVDARKNQPTRAYKMLSRGSGKTEYSLTPCSTQTTPTPVHYPTTIDGSTVNDTESVISPSGAGAGPGPGPGPGTGTGAGLVAGLVAGRRTPNYFGPDDIRRYPGSLNSFSTPRPRHQGLWAATPSSSHSSFSPPPPHVYAPYAGVNPHQQPHQHDQHQRHLHQHLHRLHPHQRPSPTPAGPDDYHYGVPPPPAGVVEKYDDRMDPMGRGPLGRI